LQTRILAFSSRQPAASQIIIINGIGCQSNDMKTYQSGTTFSGNSLSYLLIKINKNK